MIKEILVKYEDAGEMEQFLLVKRKELEEEGIEILKTVPPIQIASATYKGGYDQILRVNAAVANWVIANGYDFDGKSFCIYHVSPKDTPNPQEMVAEVCFPVKKK